MEDYPKTLAELEQRFSTEEACREYMMLKYEIDKFIFSSSAAAYGEPQTFSIEEDHPQNPINAYGESKLMFEHILDWYGRAYGIKHISLRAYVKSHIRLEGVVRA